MRDEGRVFEFDFIRVIAMIFVVCIHTPLDEIGDNQLLSTVLSAVFFTCNGIFFMLSGRFNLNIVFENKKDYIRYYIKKFISIMVPFLIISLMLFVYQQYTIGEEIICRKNIFNFYVYFFESNAASHMWFMYPLIGMIIGAPFMGRMLQNQNNQELKILLLVGLIWNTMCVYCVRDVGVTFAFDGWFLTSWIFLFVLGYVCNQIISSENEWKFILVGAMGLVITVINKILIPEHSSNIYDLAPAFVLFTFGMYIFLRKIALKIKFIRIKRVISKMAKYSYTVYMIHCVFVEKLKNCFQMISNPFVRYCTRVLVCLMIAFAVAILIDTILMNPIKKILKKLCFLQLI